MKKPLQAIHRKRAILLFFLFLFFSFAVFDIHTGYAKDIDCAKVVTGGAACGPGTGHVNNDPEQPKTKTETSFIDYIPAVFVGKAISKTVEAVGGTVACAVGAVIGDGFWKECVFVPLGQLFLGMAASLTGVAGTLLDFSIDYSLNIGKSGGDKGGLMDVIKTVWGTFRDIANMFFIFVLLYIAFATMLQVNGAETKRMLIRLVVVGLLLNFSLFFTQVVIDVSNVLAYNFYMAASVPVTQSNNAKGQLKTDVKRSISIPFAKHMDIVSLYDPDGQKKLIKEENFLNTVGTVIVLGTIFLLITAFIFFAAAIMFIIRTATLIFLMVMAPIAFIMYVLPATQDYAKKWWSALLGQAFVAPIFLLLVWVTLQVMDGVSTTSKGVKTSLVEAFSGKDSSVEVIFIFFLIIALMLVALFISKQMAGWTAATAISLAQKGTRFAGKNTLGMAGSGLMRLAAAGKGGKANRLINMMGAGLRNRTYDVGSIPGAQKVGIGAGKDTKNLAQWWKGTSDAESKRKDDVFKGIKDPSAQLRYLKSLGKGDQEKMYKNMSPSERAELRISDDKLKDRLDGTLSTEDRDKTEKARKDVSSADGAKAMITGIESGGADTGKMVQTAILKTVGDISKMNLSDIKKVAAAADKKDKNDAFINKDVVGKMNPKQMVAVSGEIDVDNAKAEKFAEILHDMGKGANTHIEYLRAASRTGNAGAEKIYEKYSKRLELAAKDKSSEPAAIQRAKNNSPTGNIG